MPSNKMNLWSTAAALLILLGAVETVTAAWNDVDDGDGDPLNNWDTVGVGGPLDVNGNTPFTNAPGSGSPANQGACQTACETDHGTNLQGYSWKTSAPGCQCWTGSVAIHSTGDTYWGTTYCLDCLKPSTSEINETPSLQPSESFQPSESSQPSLNPSQSLNPSESSKPSLQPSGSLQPSESSNPSETPSLMPSETPSLQPSETPSLEPSSMPSESPSSQPSGLPSSQPSNSPSETPSSQPSGLPSSQPSGLPSESPSSQPSSLPSGQPSGTPSETPSSQPSGLPSSQPSGMPSLQPSSQPSGLPSSQPSGMPSGSPSSQPSGLPSSQPSGLPSSQPSNSPSGQPSGQPSLHPSVSSEPSSQPSGSPSSQPSSLPSGQPSGMPSGSPSSQPSGLPSSQPSNSPSGSPSSQPSNSPSASPSSQPSSLPSSQPSSSPSSQPSNSPSESPSTNPSQGCENIRTDCGWGIFNPWTCQCDCPAGICLDNNEQCYHPCRDTINTNPWAGCVPGWDCPWYPDQDNGHCMSKMHQPNNFEIYRTKKQCCKAHYSGNVDNCVDESAAAHLVNNPFPNGAPKSFAPGEAENHWGTDASQTDHWFPDLINKRNCVFGKNYENWMQTEGFGESYLFVQPDDCCEKWFPGQGNCPDTGAAVNPEVEDEAWQSNPHPMKNYFFPDYDVNNCGYGRDYPAWMGASAYEKHYLFMTGPECCDRFFPTVGGCPYENESTNTQSGYYWTSYQDEKKNGDKMPIKYNHTFYPDIQAGTCVNGTDHPEWMASDVDYQRLYLFKGLEGCCNQWFTDSGFAKCMANVIQGYYRVDPCPINRPDCNNGDKITDIEKFRLTMWYPDMDGDKCKNDGAMEKYMLQTDYHEWYLFNTQEQCCAAFGFCV